ncbi:MAG: hypothetical protein FJ027_19780 [Candidatus Rokubacteria bacterium]|nr:hypothetical protein [Candidatus Rokubacteria bacterium]
MSRAVAVVVVAALAVMAATAGHSQTTTPAPAPAGAPVSIANLVEQTAALFPQLDGDVVEAQGQTVTLSLGRKTGVQPGVVLEAFREGREIKHPRTGAVLGRAEDPLGRVVVTQVFDGYSIAAPERAAAVKAGDRVRTVGTRVKLSIVALKGAGVRDPLVEAATTEVYEALSRSGRFQVGTGDQVAAWMSQEKLSAEDLMAGRGAREALQRFKIENLLVLHYTMVDRKPFVDARVFTASRADAALSTAFFVPPSVKPAPREQFSSGGTRAPAPEKRTQSLLARLLGIEADRATYSSGEGALALKEVARLNFAITAIDVSASPADQIPRMVLSDGEKVYVYKIVNRALEPDWTFSSAGIGRIFSVQLADITGNGTLSVVANRFDTRVGMNGYIVGLRNGKPALLADQMDTIVYAVDERGTGTKQTLWSQRYKADGFYHKGYADKVALKNGSLTRESAAVVPDTFRATGATFSNIAGKTSRSLAYIDEQSRLRITNGLDEIWRSSTQVGGGTRKIEVVRDIERGGRSYYYTTEPAPLAVDLDGDGIQEIVVPQNKDEDGVIGVVYRTAAGLRFQQVKSGFEGIIGGFGAFASEDGATPTLVTAVVRYRSLLKSGGETQIIMSVSD